MCFVCFSHKILQHQPSQCRSTQVRIPPGRRHLQPFRQHLMHLLQWSQCVQTPHYAAINDMAHGVRSTAGILRYASPQTLEMKRREDTRRWKDFVVFAGCSRTFAPRSSHLLALLVSRLFEEQLHQPGALHHLPDEADHLLGALHQLLHAVQPVSVTVHPLAGPLHCPTQLPARCPHPGLPPSAVVRFTHGGQILTHAPDILGQAVQPGQDSLLHVEQALHLRAQGVDAALHAVQSGIVRRGRSLVPAKRRLPSTRLLTMKRVRVVNPG